MANLLFLLPMPLTNSQKKKLVSYLNTALLTYTLGEIVEQELDRIYSWPSLPNSRTKRLYKNYALVYSRTELKNFLLLTYTEALGTTPPAPTNNDAPIAEGDTISTLIDTPISGDLSTSDTVSADGGNVWSLVVDAVNGTVILNPDGSYTYTPNTGFMGTDSFEYQLCDADGDCSTATITITVTAVAPISMDSAPIAVGGINTTTMDTPISGDLSLNDSPSADGGNEWSLVENASDGMVLLNPDGTYTYTPASGFVGEDRFTYQICDTDGDCSTATVTITVTSNPETSVDSTEPLTGIWVPPIFLDPADVDNLPEANYDRAARDMAAPQGMTEAEFRANFSADERGVYLHKEDGTIRALLYTKEYLSELAASQERAERIDNIVGGIREIATGMFTGYTAEEEEELMAYYLEFWEFWEDEYGEEEGTS